MADTGVSTSEGSDEPRAPVLPTGSEVDLLDMAITLSRARGLVLLIVFAVGAAGSLYVIFAPSEFTATSEVVREAGTSTESSSLPQGISSLQGLGISLGSGASGLTPSAFPKIATGREVRLAVARDTFYFPSVERRMTFVEYVNRPGLAETILGPITDAVGGLTEDASPERISSDSADGVIFPSEEEEKAIQVLGDCISTTVEDESALGEGGGLMTVTARASDPELAARMNQSVIKHLRTRVREIRTENTKETLRFVERRFQQAGQELNEAEDRLATFLEQNRSVLAGGRAPQLQFQRERLRREVQFKEQLYSQLQKQITQTRLDLKRRQPVVTVAERPAPPANPSAPNRPLIVVLSLAVGVVLGGTGAFLRSALQEQQDQEERRQKVEEVKESLTPAGLWQGIRAEIGL